MILSRQNQHIQYLLKLTRDAHFRYQEGAFVLEGRAPIAERNPEEIVFLFIPEAVTEPERTRIAAQIPPEKILPVSESLRRKISLLAHSEEPLAIVRMPRRQDLPQALGEDCLALEKIQDPGNLGTILRAAAAAGIRHVVLNRTCADAYQSKVVRSAMGAHFFLHLYPQTDLVSFLQDYEGAVYLTTPQDKASSLYDLDLSTPPAAWVLGSEGAGLSSEIMGLNLPRSTLVRVPMPGGSESLNVALTAGICLFEQVRQRQKLRN